MKKKGEAKRHVCSDFVWVREGEASGKNGIRINHAA